MMTLEQKYMAVTPIEHRKRYAQFFTPECIAEFMCDWVLDGKTKTRGLEPAYGMGVFSRILTRKSSLDIDAYEIDERIFSKAKSVCAGNVNLRNEDYFQSGWSPRYDAIVCNPPYLKFHDYDNALYVPDVNEHLGTRLNGFTNLYTLFLLKSLAQLTDDGRLAYIVPSEFLNSDYGVEVKRALLKSGFLRYVIVVDFTECAFNDAITTACILLCEKENETNKVRFSTVAKIDKLKDCLFQFVEYDVTTLRYDVKWKSYYEESNCAKYQHLVPFSRFAKVSRGIATGANEYFTFKPSKAVDFNVPQECLMPCVCRAVDAPKTFFTHQDFEKLLENDKTVYLFNGGANPYNCNVAQYIRLGEDSGINRRYLTASRSPWYAIEHRPPAPIWVSVFNRRGLRFIRNEANIYNLTTFHCVYPKSGEVDVDILFAYLISDVAKEIFTDNSRQYGNGLVKYEPNDLNKGKVVNLSLLTQSECDYIKDVYSVIRDNMDETGGIKLLNDFFRMKYAYNSSSVDDLSGDFDSLKSKVPHEERRNVIKANRLCVKQMNLFDRFE